MPTIQVSGFPVKTTPVDADSVHLKGASDNGDYQATIAGLKTVLVANQIATNGEALAGTDNIKLMTPLRNQAHYESKVASQAQAEAATNNTQYMTPLRVDDASKVNAPYLLIRSNPLTGGATLVKGKYYNIQDSGNYTLPSVTGFTGDERVTMTKRALSSPVVLRDGTNSEQIRINGTTLDTSITFDINSEIIFIYNISTNEWEV